MSLSQTLALRALCDAVVSAVDAGGNEGASGGILYTAMMQDGCTMEQFQALMSGMIGAGLLCKVGERYFLGEVALAARCRFNPLLSELSGYTKRCRDCGRLESEHGRAVS